MRIIGELINSTRPRVQPLLKTRHETAIVTLARRQASSGAHLIDVNCAALLDDEPECLAWTIRAIQDALDVRISVDSPNPVALRRGLAAHRGQALVNSISLEQERWASVLPLVVEFQAAVVALCVDGQGIPATADGRLAIAGRLVEGLTHAGISTGDIYLDPLALPVATDGRSVAVMLDAVDLIRARFPEVHVVCGVSNVSFGLPRRSEINRMFLVLCMAHGVDTFILDPLDERLMAEAITARMLLGQDEFCRDYIRAARAGRFDGPRAAHR